MTEIMPVPRNLILLSYQQGAFPPLFYSSLNIVIIPDITQFPFVFF